MPTPSACTRSDSSWFCDSFCDEALATLRILPRSGSTAWRSRSRACLAEPPAESPSTMKISVPCLELRLQSASLPGSRSLRVARLPADLLLALALEALLGLVDGPVEQLGACCGRVGQPVVEGIAHRVLDDAGGFLRGELVLGLALELGLADEHREHGGGRAQHVVGGDLAGAPVADALAEVAQRLAERRAEAVLVRAALGGRDGVAVGVEEAVLVGDPAHRPLDRAVPALACSMRPAKMSLVTRVWPSMVASRYSFRPPGKWNVASAGVSSVISAGAHDQRISTPPNR